MESALSLDSLFSVIMAISSCVVKVTWSSIVAIAVVEGADLHEYWNEGKGLAGQVARLIAHYTYYVGGRKRRIRWGVRNL